MAEKQRIYALERQLRKAIERIAKLEETVKSMQEEHARTRPDPYEGV